MITASIVLYKNPMSECHAILDILEKSCVEKVYLIDHSGEDLNMPKLDGFAVLDYMTECDLLQKMPVTIISGDSSKEAISKAFTYQIVDMLNKPFSEQKIREAVEKTMNYDI